MGNFARFDILDPVRLKAKAAIHEREDRRIFASLVPQGCMYVDDERLDYHIGIDMGDGEDRQAVTVTEPNGKVYVIGEKKPEPRCVVVYDERLEREDVGTDKA